MVLWIICPDAPSLKRFTFFSCRHFIRRIEQEEQRFLRGMKIGRHAPLSPVQLVGNSEHRQACDSICRSHRQHRRRFHVYCKDSLLLVFKHILAQFAERGIGCPCDTGVMRLILFREKLTDACNQRR